MPKLRPYRREVHFKPLTRWFVSELDLVQWGGPALRFPLTPDQVEDGDGSVDSPTTRNWVALDGQRMVGHAQLILDHRSGNATLSKVAIAPDRRGQGLAVPMLRAVLKMVFASRDFERTELHVFTWNTPAIRAYERLGFKLEGVRRSSARSADGVRWDTAFMGILRNEWIESSAALDKRALSQAAGTPAPDW
jgi:RimJ/RimL family protein N-acetyltransferase